ncbi:MAG: efflux RND transporter periplasmic adaptor subunit [Bacteroidetes bacterium]|nr:efflux RND transporter periplasmic adaptor subunit [Bacteroidota bacterium]
MKVLLKHKIMNSHQLSTMRKIRLLPFAIMIITVFSACKQKSQSIAEIENNQGKAYYTCSMHPQVCEDHPGNCPICGMKLIKVELTGSGNANNRIILTEAQIRLAGIQTDTVRKENTADEKTLTGTVTFNENETKEISARIAGRIQQLFVRAIGKRVAIGEPIYSLYSEDLLTAEKEYLLARQQQSVLHNPDVDYKQLIDAAEHKLQLWGLSAQEIKNLAVSGKTSSTVNILSTVNGTVSGIDVHEGDYATEGMTIFKVKDLNNLWVEAQLYASETGNYKLRENVKVSFPDLGGQAINGSMEFINPELSETSKVDLIRIDIPNPQGLIRPGMLAYISIASGQKNTLAVPASAVLTNGKGSMVWIKNADGSFSSRMVKLGSGNSNYVSIVSGLEYGEVVVSKGAYLLNSEAIFKNGEDKMDMGNRKM